MMDNAMRNSGLINIDTVNDSLPSIKPSIFFPNTIRAKQAGREPNKVATKKVPILTPDTPAIAVTTGNGTNGNIRRHVK